MIEQVKEFLDHIVREKGYSENTLAAYRNDLTQFAAFVQPTVSRWDDVDSDMITAYIMRMKAEQEYASSTVARKVAAVKSFFHYLADHGRIGDDPTAKLDSPKVRKRLPKAISMEDMERLLREPARLSTPSSLRDRALLELLYATGLRVTELVSLNVEDVNLASATLRVPHAKGKRVRHVPVHQRAIEPLQSYLDRGRVPLLNDPEERALLLNHRGQRLTRQGLWLIVKRYVQEVGISSDVTPQTMRHTFAAHLLDKKADLEYVRELLGHANIATTQVYTHVSQDEAADSE